MCRKPWLCVSTGAKGNKLPGRERGSALNEYMVNVDHCLALQKRWHDLRVDLETKLYDLTGDKSILNGRNGTYMTDIFGGHCNGDGKEHYNIIGGKDESFERIGELYETKSLAVAIK